jgi:hypothetical protein
MYLIYNIDQMHWLFKIGYPLIITVIKKLSVSLNISTYDIGFIKYDIVCIF